ncbi:galactose mutarotase [Dyadobacter sp. CY345]|uniref:aldose epimerase family protein n=1 Tax=Dyadobacter sp. CY345 TaxID=2909335 RepID=UPI001F4033D9|nr:aldose epimerase family protein [Dyadobacter sp. CY345]MCF2443412.1 galactose mutarotase [Dyadobacter sp. CY345]
MQNQKRISLFTLKNNQGIIAEILDYGAIIKSLKVPDKTGETTNVVLGYQTPEDYLTDQYYIGSVIGRYANRISNGSFELEGKRFQLSRNNDQTCLHGGFNGFNKKIWETINHTANSLTLQYVSQDMEEGFPGNLTIMVSYTLTEKNELKIDYQAVTDLPTHVNFTQHSYFNLSGRRDKTIENHFLQIFSNQYLPNNEQSVPKGHFESVQQTPFSFIEPQQISEALQSTDAQMRLDLGINHSFLLKTKNSPDLQLAAGLFSPASGIAMKTYTTEPGIHVYCANYFGKENWKMTASNFPQYAGICLETQHFADSPNHSTFPSTLLLPGEFFNSRTIYSFENIDQNTE